ncbi:MAG: hypothetical protein AAFQ50_03585, partial [Pseudomonadota bacterium]
MIPADRLDQILARFEFLEARLNAGPEAEEIAALTREYSDVKPVAELIRHWRGLVDQMGEAQALLQQRDLQLRFGILPGGLK